MMHTNYRVLCRFFYKQVKSHNSVANQPVYDPTNTLGYSEDTGDMWGHVHVHHAPLRGSSRSREPPAGTQSGAGGDRLVMGSQNELKS